MKHYNFILLTLFLTLSCARSYLVKNELTEQTVEKVNFLSVAFYRPDFDPADHDDFKNKNRNLKCQPPQEIWNKLLANSKNLIDCLNSLKDNRVATYFYVSVAQPYLEIDQEEELNPKCLKVELANIPLPREIYFQGTSSAQDTGPLQTFATSFSTKTNQVLKTELKFLKKKIELPFPLSRELKNNQDLLSWLLATVFNIQKYDSASGGTLKASFVPDDLAKACFSYDRFFEEKRQRRLKPAFWP